MGQKVSVTDDFSEPSPDNKEEINKRRGLIVKEIKDTEKEYVNGLHAMVRVYQKPLKRALSESNPIISQEEINSIFSIVDEIIEINESILYELELVLNKWDDKQLIGEIFISKAKSLKLYTEYVNNYDNAIATYARLMKENKKFESYISKCREHPEINHDLPSYLITPIQRIPRYILLLNELIKNTYKTHKDRKNLLLAYHSIKEVADHVNTQKRLSEGIHKLEEIEKLFKNSVSLVSEDRQLISEGEIVSKKNKFKYYLFNDSILVGIEKSSIFSKKHKVHVFALLMDITLAYETKKAVIKYQDKEYEITFDDENEGKAWFDKVNGQIQLLKSKKKGSKSFWSRIFG